jgi:putative cell wall-binding protein
MSGGARVGAAAGRLGGADRYETAALVAAAVEQAAGRAPGTTPAVVVASGEDAAGGVDALAASFVAAHVGGPVLLTRRDAVPAATTAALAALLGTEQSGAQVVVMGGTGVVSEGVARALAAAGATVTRVAGDDRYATAAAAARAGAASIGSYALLAGNGPARTAVLAGGLNPADGLSSGPLLHAAKVPLLLTQRDALPATTLGALRDLGITQVVAVGGSAAIGSGVFYALQAAGVRAVTVAGATRYDTAAVLMALASAPQLGGGGYGTSASPDVGGFGLPFADATSGYLANGLRFPDALTCGPLAGTAGRPLFLTSPDGLSPETAGLLAAASASSLTGVGLGGALPDAVLAQAAAAAAH